MIALLTMLVGQIGPASPKDDFTQLVHYARYVDSDFTWTQFYDHSDRPKLRRKLIEEQEDQFIRSLRKAAKVDLVLRLAMQDRALQWGAEGIMEPGPNGHLQGWIHPFDWDTYNHKEIPVCQRMYRYWTRSLDKIKKADNISTSFGRKFRKKVLVHQLSFLKDPEYDLIRRCLGKDREGNPFLAKRVNTKYLVELEKGNWLDGDSLEAVDMNHATLFDSQLQARKALERARKNNKYAGAKIIPMNI